MFSAKEKNIRQWATVMKITIIDSSPICICHCYHVTIAFAQLFPMLAQNKLETLPSSSKYSSISAETAVQNFLST